jgi:glyoxylase I family protein
MAIDHVLSVVAVTDIATASQWYERLFGKAPTNRPMDPLAEWRVTDNGWVQVWVDAERAGKSALNLAVGDLHSHVAELAGRGIECGEIQTVNKGVQLASTTDPDGNAITLIGGFRIDY